jgi:hypothetical protein
MSESLLSFQNSATFRNKLITRTLPKYSVAGFYSSPQGPTNYETVLSDFSDTNSPGIGDTNIANLFYPLNEYGPNGGFVNQISFNGPAQINSSNQGEYNPNSTQLFAPSEPNRTNAFVKNVYGPIGGYNNLITLSEIQIIDQIHQNYWEPPSFNNSSYDTYNLFLNNDPSGSNGFLSNDSYIAKLGQESLRTNFNASIAAIDSRQLYRQTNTSQTSPSALAGNGLGGSVDFRITLSPSPISFLDALQGNFSPTSPIEGGIFIDDNEDRSPTTFGQLQNVSQNIAGGSLNLLGGFDRYTQPSRKLLEQTGGGQVATLYSLLNKNIFKPSYVLPTGGNVVINGVNGVLRNFGAAVEGGFYVGSDINNPSFIGSPLNAIPVDAYGNRSDAMVFGPDELSNIYEGDSSIGWSWGLGGFAYDDCSKPDAGMVWISPRFFNNAGFRVKQGGDAVSIDDDFNQIASTYFQNVSDRFNFKQGSILDETQRLVNAADNITGVRRLKHAGNAINQISKVFHDGYREITKGSKVLKYLDNSTGEEAGIQYQRVFTKDTPYYTFNDLQKVEGITISNRRFQNSVFDRTYNLNIAPTKGLGSTSVGIKNAKKYMISIENLAWRTSDRPGFTYEDLPISERGPNGGRIMWFPPYDLSFKDSSTASFDEVPFLGRPEPVYTYKNTTRTGNLSFKIVVDHPSIMNLLVNKQLANISDEKFQSIVNSFIAGATKYDLYELAAKFNTLPLRELEAYQNILNDNRLTEEELQQIQNSIPKENTNPENAQTVTSKQTQNETFINENKGKLGFYFFPGSTTFVESIRKFENDNDLIEQNVPTTVSVDAIQYTKTTASAFRGDVFGTNYDQLNGTFGDNLLTTISNNNTVSIKISGKNSTFAEAAKNWMSENFKTQVDNGDLIITTDGSLSNVTVYKFETNSSNKGQTFQTSPTITNVTGDGNIIYSYPALASNVAIISDIVVKEKQTDTDPSKQNNLNQSKPDQPNPQTVKPQPNTDLQDRLKQQIGKKIVRTLLNEQDYFEMLKDSDPIAFKGLKSKLKYFNPAFHSTTPEGLNARLTFLNQCVRPGQTIPVIGPDGKPKYNDALNTSFGAPPVLVIRVGDFYHTKAIPGSISIDYDTPQLDINPEGIGLQPMVAKISIDLKFIGGHGLAQPIESLQNALSFNFYANTEMYDERAEETELNYALVELVDKAIANQTQGDITGREGGETIGSILTTAVSGDVETGDIDYSKLYNQTATQTTDYVNVSYNQIKSLNDITNYSMYTLLTSKRNFTSGDTMVYSETPQKTYIFGKPEDYEKKLNKLSSKIKEDIDSNTNPLVGSVFNIPSITEPILRNLKKDLKKYVESVSKEIVTDTVDPLNQLISTQQNLVTLFNKMNIVTMQKIPAAGPQQNVTGQDGKISTKGDVIFYDLTDPKKVFDKMLKDYFSIKDTCNNLNKLYMDQRLLPEENTSLYDDENCFSINGFNDELKNPDKRFYTLLSQTFTNPDKYPLFVSYIITPQVKQAGLEESFKKILNEIKNSYIGIYQEQSKIVNSIDSGNPSVEYQNLKTFKLEETDRKLLYKTATGFPDSSYVIRQDRILDIYSPYNPIFNRSTFNGKNKLN